MDLKDVPEAKATETRYETVAADRDMKRLTWPVTIATIVGLIVAVWMIGLVGLHRLAQVMATAGMSGFALFLASYSAVLIALGAAWATSMRGEPRYSIWTFVRARAVREAAADLLPFSQIGGLMFGLQILLRSGIAPARAHAAKIVDLTTEMVAQLLLVLMGLAVFFYTLGGTRNGSDLASVTWAGLAVMVALTGCLVFLQRPALRLMAGLSVKLVPSAREMIEVVHAELTAFASAPAASLWPASCNLVACLLSIFSAWIGFDVLGTHVSIGDVLALEALIYTLRSGAFFVPGALGIQEAAYVLLAALLGIDREAGLDRSGLMKYRKRRLVFRYLLIANLRDSDTSLRNQAVVSRATVCQRVVLSLARIVVRCLTRAVERTSRLPLFEARKLPDGKVPRGAIPVRDSARWPPKSRPSAIGKRSEAPERLIMGAFPMGSSPPDGQVHRHPC